jgi:hypothetical protein
VDLGQLSVMGSQGGVELVRGKLGKVGKMYLASTQFELRPHLLVRNSPSDETEGKT